MKKYYTTKEYKNRQSKINNYGKKINKITRKSPSYTLKIKDDKNIVINKRTRTETVIAPENFSMIYNIDEMLVFFNSLYNCINENKYEVYLNMSNIKNITSDAILYLLSVLDYHKSNPKYHHSVSGNVPIDEKCAEMLLESGFPNYVRMKHSIEYKSSNFLRVEKHNLVRADIADNVISFSENKLNYYNKEITDSIYVTIVECMNNTKQHAFSDNKKGKWWLIAQFNSLKNKVHFCLLDNGQGIPKSVKITFREKLKEFTPLIKNYHSKLIKSALDGEFRSQTGMGYRGKGLPKIKSYSDQKFIDELIIISKKGFVNLENNELKELEHNFYGTLVSWNFIGK